MSDTFHILVPREIPRLLSIVIPVYNEEKVLPLLVDRLRQLADQFPCPVEMIMVNDGSSDQSIAVLHETAMRDCRFSVVGLSRNYGHQIAATAGLDASRGDAVVLMDADLQDTPELILNMLAEYLKGYDVVYAQRTGREGETALKRFTAWAFYRLMRAMVYKDLPPDVGDYRLISRRCLDALRSMRETHRFLRGMVSWVGFPQTAVPFVRQKRAAGQTKYPLHKMMRFAWTAAVSFSPLPLRLSFVVGGGLFTIGLAYTLYAIVRLVLGLYLVPGWTSLIIINCLGSGAVMLSIGVLGEYVAKIFEEIKQRPLYIVSDRFNLAAETEAQPAERVGHSAAK
jgi:glycosyltransferase involved in cell wall biosynthesis